MEQGAIADVQSPAVSQSPLRFWAIAAALTMLLILGYWFFIRTTYEPVLTNVAPQDAADIVKVLEAQKITYQLADGGSTIRVASDQADKARIELIGSELPMRGQVGFELFNQSDMGLTEFAQKINYQRALQGELARTILLVDGIQSVRVHLALPDHNLFRDEQSQPKASVTLILKPGKTMTEGTVAGIQRLIAGAIPDMGASAVAVLDGSGRVVSQDGSFSSEPIGENDAIIQNYRHRIAAGISANHPELRVGINVSLRFIDVPGQVRRSSANPSAIAGLPSISDNAVTAPRGSPDYALAVRITTIDPMDDSLRSDVARIVQTTIGFATVRGDSIVFLTGPLIPTETTATAKLDGNQVVAQGSSQRAPTAGTSWEAYWPIAIAIIIVALALAYWNDRRRVHDRNVKDLSAFSDELRKRLVAHANPA